MQKIIPNKILWFGIFISIIAIIANLIFFVFSKALGEQYLIPLTESSTVTSQMSVAMIILATLFSALLATGLYSLLAKIAPNDTATFSFNNRYSFSCFIWWANGTPRHLDSNQNFIKHDAYYCRCNYYWWILCLS